MTNLFTSYNLYSVLANDECISYSIKHTDLNKLKTMLKENRRTRLDVKVVVKTVDTGDVVQLSALIDLGATGMFMDEQFIREQGWNLDEVPRPIPVFNIDGTLNANGNVKNTIDLALEIQGHQELATFTVTHLSGVKMILGHSWLKQHNPRINWKKGKLTLMRCQCQSTKRKALPACIEEAPDKDEMEVDNVREDVKVEKIGKGDRIFMVDIEAFEDEHRREEGLQMMEQMRSKRKEIVRKALMELGCSKETSSLYEDSVAMDQDEYAWVDDYVGVESYDWIGASRTKSQELNLEALEGEEEKSPEEHILPEFMWYKLVFMKESFDQLPPRRPWDHAIELIPGSDLHFSKVYPMNPIEQKELDDFLEENLTSGRICPLKSPMALPVFFIKKKDGGLRLI